MSQGQFKEEHSLQELRTTKGPELLAPAGDFAALQAAVENGADAVYLGGKAFSARASASNFSGAEIEEAVNYAHLRGARVYVALNTLLTDSELPEALDFTYHLQQIGVDALIIQDLGLQRALRQVFPDLKLHASTQMTIHNTEGARFAAEQGLERIVLAREVSLQQIAAIKRQAKVEVEVFIHGALCICYSGQCLMSSFIGGRSGNRGRCAQPCRLTYQLEPIGKTSTKIQIPKGTETEQAKAKLPESRHLLSPRDLNTLEILPQLCSAGIDALKIEGRMKRTEYVATVVRIYRQALDRYQSNPEEYRVFPEEMQELAQIFNRDFTSGYLLEKPGTELMSYQRPNNRGVFVGRIEKWSAPEKRVWLKLERDLHRKDGLEVWVTRGGRKGLIVQQMWVQGIARETALAGETVEIPVELSLRPGDRVFKTHDAQLMQKALDSAQPNAKKIPLRVSVQVSLGQPLYLRAEDDQGHQCTITSDVCGEAARQHPLTEETVYKQLNRLGNTAFSLGAVEYDLAPGVMLPIRTLNQVRREMVAEIERQRFAQRTYSSLSQNQYQEQRKQWMGSHIARTDHRFGSEKPESFQAKAPGKQAQRPALAVAVGDWNSALVALEAGAEVLYLPDTVYRSKVRFHAKAAFEKFVQASQDREAGLVASLPRIIGEGEQKQIQRQIEQLNRAFGPPRLGWLTGNLGGIKLLQQAQVERIYGDYALNCFNPQAAWYLQELGLSQITLSPELNLEQLKAFSGFFKDSDFLGEMILHGSWPLMVSEHCVVGAVQGRLDRPSQDCTTCTQPCKAQQYYLRDRLDYQFPLETDSAGRTYIYNAKVLDLLENLEAITDLGLRSLRLEIRRETPTYVGAVVQIYRQELDRLQRHKQAGKKYTPLPENQEKLKGLAPAGFTRGHFFRGVE